MKLLDAPVILFNKKFDDESLSVFLEKFYDVEASGSNKIGIMINSPGGSLDCLKTMLDAVYNTEMSVITIASGLAASCGFALLMAGDHRVAFDGTMLMSHQYSWGSKGKHHELTAARKAQDMTHKFMLEHYKLHTGLGEKQIQKELLPAEDRWMSPQEALALGVIDEVIYPTAKPIGKIAKDKLQEKNRKEDILDIKEAVSQFTEKEFSDLLKDRAKNTKITEMEKT
jgi:ATP-dependent Clp endopeptidase proteolytic subunit ClpP